MIIGLLNFLNQNVIWILFVIVFCLGSAKRELWTTSIRSVVTLVITFVFAQLALTSKIEAKDVMLVLSLVYNFYFLVKQRNGEISLRKPDDKPQP